eukprot:5243775-Pleurochrysis_carterae.AAC.2
MLTLRMATPHAFFAILYEALSWLATHFTKVFVPSALRRSTFRPGTTGATRAVGTERRTSRY